MVVFDVKVKKLFFVDVGYLFANFLFKKFYFDHFYFGMPFWMAVSQNSYCSFLR